MRVTRKISTRAAEKFLVFLIDFPEIFSFLLSFAFFDFCFFLFVGLLLFEIKNVYSDTHSTMRVDK